MTSAGPAVTRPHGPGRRPGTRSLPVPGPGTSDPAWRPPAVSAGGLAWAPALLELANEFRRDLVGSLGPARAGAGRRQPGSKMQLIVAVAGHQHIVVNVENHDSAHTIKKGVEKVFGLPANHQILRHSGKQVGKSA